MACICCSHYILTELKVLLKTHIYLDGLSSGRISQIEGFETSLSILNTHKPTIHSNSTYFLTVTLTQHVRVTCETLYLILCNAVCSFSSLILALPLIWFIVITDTPTEQTDVSMTQIRHPKSQLWSNPHQLYKCQLGLTGQSCMCGSHPVVSNSWRSHRL